MGLAQRIICCPCGSIDLHARGLCLRCYDQRRRSLQRFGGLREQVLLRDMYRCTNPACGRPTNVVHHRRPRGLVTLCPSCHARVERTLYVRWCMDEYLRQLWREKHPGRPEQLPLELGTGPQRETSEQLPLIVLAN